MFGYIYKTTNLVNNKIYVGQHKSSKFNPNYLGSGTTLRKCFKKYGRSSFRTELLEECNSKEELDEKEIKYIALLNSTNPDIGYNITFGGQNRFFTGQKHTDETRKKMREKALNRPHPPTTAGRKSYTNGTENKMLLPCDAQKYIEMGWKEGKTMKNPFSWNKGKTKYNDSRIRGYAEKRQKVFEAGQSIGFCRIGEAPKNGFKTGQTPWNKGLKGYNNGHPNYYLGKNKKVNQENSVKK